MFVEAVPFQGVVAGADRKATDVKAATFFLVKKITQYLVSGIFLQLHQRVPSLFIKASTKAFDALEFLARNCQVRLPDAVRSANAAIYPVAVGGGADPASV